MNLSIVVSDAFVIHINLHLFSTNPYLYSPTEILGNFSIKLCVKIDIGPQSKLSKLPRCDNHILF